jgi:ribonuclease HI
VIGKKQKRERERGCWMRKSNWKRRRQRPWYISLSLYERTLTILMSRRRHLLLKFVKGESQQKKSQRRGKKSKCFGTRTSFVFAPPVRMTGKSQYEPEPRREFV